MSDRPRNAESIYNAARQLRSGLRADFLRKACAGDAVLRNEVERLLSPDGQDHGGIEDNNRIDVTSDADRISPSTHSLTTDSPDDISGEMIGPYKLLQEIGRGGMGLVYMAEQTEPVKRKVAVKVIKPGMDSAMVIARFEAERQALAMMDHEGIARVFDAGTTSRGRPYFVMELVRGVPITDYCNENRLVVRERLDLFVAVCQAIQHAHQKGIIHRDIKPSNVLVCNYDGRAVPKIIDFGVAKAMQQSLTEKTMYTQYGQVIGTLEYMSPEQAGMSQLDIDTRSDVYSLGVLLYELLTGTTPLNKQQLRSAGFDEMMRLIREHEAPKPSTRLSQSGDSLPAIATQRQSDSKRLGGLIRGDLDWIVLKSLEKDRTRRYDTANGLARDIQRHLNDEAVDACPPSASYKLRKFARKYRAGISIAAGFAVILLVSAIVGIWQAIEISEQRDTARAAEGEANQERSKTAEALVTAEQAQVETEKALVVARRNEERASGLLGRAEQLAYAGRLAAAQLALANGKSAWLPELANCRWDLRGWEYDYLVAVSGEGKGRGRRIYHGARVAALAFHPQGHLLAIGGANSLIKVWDVSNKEDTKLVLTLKGHAQQVSSLAFTPNGERIISGSYDGTLKVWNAKTGDLLVTFEGHSDKVRSLSVNLDSQRVVSGGEDTVVRVWDLESGKQLFGLIGHTDAVRSVAFSADGSKIVSGSADKTLRVWNVNNQKLIRTLNGHTDRVSCVALTKNGQRAVSGSWDKTLRLWNLETGKSIQTFRGHTHLVTSVTFANDERAIISAGWDKKTKLWNVESGELVRTLVESNQTMSCLASTKSRLVASGSWGGSVVLTDLTETGRDRLKGHTREIKVIALSSDGKELISGDGEGVLKIWDMATRKEIQSLIGPPRPLVDIAFNQDGKRFFTCYANGQALIWDRKKGKPIKAIRGHKMSPAGKTAVAVSNTTFFRSATLCDVETDEDLQTFDYKGELFSAMTFSDDAEQFAIASRKGQIQVWSTSTGIELSRFQHGDMVTGLAFHPGGKMLVSASDGVMKVWDCQNQTLAATRFINGQAVAFQPNGHRLFVGTTANGGGRVTVWDTATWRRLLAIDGHSGGVSAMVISPNGKQVITGGDDREVRIWDTDSKFSVAKTTLGRHDVPITSVAQNLAHQVLVSGSQDGFIKIWDALSGSEKLSFKAHQGAVIGLHVSADGQSIVSRSESGVMKLWEMETGKQTANTKTPPRKTGSTEKTTLLSGLPVVVNANGTRAIFALTDGGLRTWDTLANQQLDLAVPKVQVTSLSFSPDEKLIACGAKSGEVLVFNATNGEKISEMTGHEGPIIDLSFDAQGGRLASVNGKGMLRVESLTSRKELDSRQLPVISRGPTMGIGDLGTGPLAFSKARVRITKRKPKKQRPPVLSVLFSPSGYRMIQGFRGVYVADIAAKE